MARTLAVPTSEKNAMKQEENRNVQMKKRIVVEKLIMLNTAD